MPGKVFSGSNFRFRAIGGCYRVVVRGFGVYLFAGGHGHVTLRGSSVNPRADGWYSVDGKQVPLAAASTRAAEDRRRLTMAPDQQKILVVEDEQAIASFVAAYLRKDGFTVRMTASGREALASSASTLPRSSSST